MSEIRELGEIAYVGYFNASGGKSLISGASLPAWDEQAPEIRQAWNLGAMDVVDYWREAGDGDERLPDDAPEPAKVIVVVTEGGRVGRYNAPNFGMLHDGTLVIGDKTEGDDLRVDAALAPGRWQHVHKEGVMAGDDRDTKALVIARRALSQIYGRAHGENDAEDLEAVIELADQALADIADVDL